MSDNPLTKINQSVLAKSAVLLLLTVVIVANVRVIVDNIVNAKGIDEQIVSEANPRLNKKLIQEAIETLESFSSSELTSISPSATVEIESTNSGIEQQSSVAIQNASGVNGAASEFAAVLAQQGYQISAISTAPSLEGQTLVLFKPGKAEEAQNIEQLLRDEGWSVAESQESNRDQQFDLLIVLGK